MGMGRTEGWEVFVCWGGVLDARRGFMMASWGFLAVDWGWRKFPGEISEIMMV